MSVPVEADGNPMTSHDRQRRAAADAPAARTRRPIQARLEVGPVDDPMEVEAEATADRVIAAIQTSGGAQPVAARKEALDEEAGGGPAGGGGGPAAAADSKKLPAGLSGGAPTNEVGEAKTVAGGGPSPAELKNTGGAPAGLDEEEAKRAPVDSISRMSGPEEELPTQGFRVARVEDEDLLQGSRISRVEEEEPLQGFRVARTPEEDEERRRRAAAAAAASATATAPSAPAPARRALDVRRGGGVPINDDPGLEQEADEMGAKAMQLARVNRAGGLEEELPTQGSRTARSSAVGAEGGAVDADLESRLTAGGGAPLPEPVRATMEGAFGADFSAVRVSENPAAAEIGALAYTTGADVRFAPGQFKPGSTEGQHLLAHELTHVVQQGAAPGLS